MEEVFTSRSSAVARIMAARMALMKDSDTLSLNAGEKAARLERLERLLFDVRADRINDFTMPTADGEVRIFVSPD
ncbi:MULTISPECIES: hypothetical protein [Paraburkholderia]|jgi:hypothetical protein|uniref:Uncharacterized protein n=1 Tax=Paraburkholderia largidicola TaxID=3014751 RepID=A0A7I8BRD5_9BURK|nr:MULTISPECIES: hypothetical protein [Paraburkholderia]BCF91254.1 hypothetical protein PPGU16_43210 [Paraburkholderia sp. PGU16]GJH02081.1 hypothetical protein CBA19C8_16010 [Paraburkholderia terrae]GJH36453.1 hypothetical protein CBA19CS91_26870 [Paraburkholderia hospita]